jgi:ribosomal protein L11 methyltransferase
MLELFPAGFEERQTDGGVELAAYTTGSGEERLWASFGGVSSAAIEPGWERRWRDFHRPVRIGPLWIGPPWIDPPKGAVAISIDPGRAFGTGAHATTRLCLELLLELERSSLLDVGCGSGVVAIAAAKLGFEPAFAIDREPAAVEAAERNAARNGVSIRVSAADALEAPLPGTGVAVANVNLALAEQLAGRASWRQLVVSGYLEAERPAVAGYGHRARRTADGWAADLFVAV